jgi:hypothetical protein
MKTKSLLLRVAMLVLGIVGILAMNQPVRALSCVRGGECSTATSFGTCGGTSTIHNACDCFGDDGSVKRLDYADCLL